MALHPTEQLVEQLVEELSRTENPARIEKLLREALGEARQGGYLEGLRAAAGVVRPSETHGQLAHPVRVALESAARALDVGAGVVASGRSWPPKGGR